MEEEILIGPLSNGNCQQIVDLILPIQQVEFGVPITIEAQPDLLDIEASYIRPGGGFWGAIAGERLVRERMGMPEETVRDRVDGMIVGSIALMNVGHGAGVIRKMFVKKEFRGKELSIAQRLLDTLVAYCRENGICDLYLGTVDRMKAAHRFYERNGFRPIAMEALPSYFPRMLTDNLFYHLHL
jgi:GNAT superfamily N-acetyltransferase